ncbi:hypothetical protein [Micromonospora chersina]
MSTSTNANATADTTTGWVGPGYWAGPGFWAGPGYSADSGRGWIGPTRRWAGPGYWAGPTR